MDYGKLSKWQQGLVDKWKDGVLSRKVDEANMKYGHGIARTNDFGYEPGQNMNMQIPTDVAATLRNLKRGLGDSDGAEEPVEKRRLRNAHRTPSPSSDSSP